MNHFKLKSAMLFSLRSPLIPFCLSTLLLCSCGDDSPLSNHPPTVINTESYAKCERREGDFALTEITFVIEDLEGSDTLSTPYVEYGTLNLTMTSEPIVAPTQEEIEAAEASGSPINECPVESCQMRYSWTYRVADSDSALIGCPADAPQIFVRIFDKNTNSKEFFLQPRRGE